MRRPRTVRCHSPIHTVLTFMNSRMPRSESSGFYLAAALIESNSSSVKAIPVAATFCSR